MAEVERLYGDGLSRIGPTVDRTGVAFTSLNLSEKQLDSIEAIKNYVHLQFVDLSKNALTDLSPLAALQYLVILKVPENAIETPPVFQHEHLQLVDISNNSLTTLVGMEGPSITSLKLKGNKLTSLDGISSFNNLISLDASECGLLTTEHLDGTLSKLEKLILGDNEITELQGIDQMQALKHLNIRKNKISDLAELEKLSSLENLAALDLQDNPICSADNYRLDVLICLPRIRTLDEIQVTDTELLESIEIKKQRIAEAEAAALEAEED